MHVADVMTKQVEAVSPDAPLKDVAALLAARRISGVPVCDADGRLLGVVSEQDILYKEIGDDGGRARRFRRSSAVAHRAKAAARTAADAMTSPALTIGPLQSVAAAAQTMVEESVNRLPVVDRSGALVGIVTRADLVRAFARGDAEIALEIERDVFARSLWLEPGSASVEVIDGDVLLSGIVDRRSEAEMAEHLAGRVPGVVSVRSELSWRSDNVSRHVRSGVRPA